MRRSENGHPEMTGGDMMRGDGMPPTFLPPFFAGNPTLNRPVFGGPFGGGHQGFNQMGIRVPFNGPLNPIAPNNQRPNLNFGPDVFGPPGGFVPPGFNPSAPPPGGFGPQRFSPPTRPEFQSSNNSDLSYGHHNNNFAPGRVVDEPHLGASQQNWGMSEVPVGNQLDPRLGPSRDTDFRRVDSQSDPRVTGGPGSQTDVDLRLRSGPFPNIAADQDYRGPPVSAQPPRDPRMRPRQEQPEFPSSGWQGWSGSDVTPWPIAANTDGSWAESRRVSKVESWSEPSWSEDQRRMREGDKWNDE